MSRTALQFWDHPAPEGRLEKGAWLQRRELMGEAARDCLADFPVTEPVATFIGPDSSLARALSVDLGLPVRHARPDEPPDPGHLVVTEVHAGARHQERVDLLTGALRWLRPAGRCILVATVVATPGQDATPTASVGQIIRELSLAWRERFHVDDIRSFRWLTEPFVRGVVLTITALQVPQVAGQ